MIIQLHKNLANSDLQIICKTLKERNYSITPVNTQFENYLICIGKLDIDLRIIGHL